MSGSQLLLLGGTPQVASDPNFEYTTLLLPGNGTNGAQNNTFLDSSTNNFTITRNGNTTQGTFSPFSQTGWGNYFDGNADYLTVANNVALQMSGDFTWEAWVYPLSLPGGANFKTFWAQRASGTTGSTIGGPLVVFDSAGSLLLFIANAASNAWSVSGFDTGLDVSLNQWQHIALVKSGTTVTLYKNGTGGTSTTHSTAVGTSGSLSIMAGAADGAQVVDGYMSNFRVVKGTAVYTSNFTPSTTPLTAITNTSLLTCQSNRFVDNSSNAFAITRNGDVSVQAFSPFNPTAAWSAATYGGSGYFDGSGDYLNGPSTGQFAPTGDFTISMWIYPTSFAASFYVLAGSWAGAGAANEWLIQYDNTGAIRFLTTTDSTFSAAGVIKLNQWQFLSISRTGSTLTGYVNGTSFRSYTLTGTVGSATKVVYIGAQQGTTWPYIGYMADFRMVAGSAESATPPTAPATAISGTNMLLNFTNAGIYDATSKNDLETVGNAQISTTQSKFGGSSMYFDGTGDWLAIPFSQNIVFGSGDFTCEFWVYFNTVSARQEIVFFGNSAGTNVPLLVELNTAFKIRFLIQTSGGQIFVDSAATPTVNTWTHVACVRYGSTAYLFVNGVSQGSISPGTNALVSQTTPMYIGIQTDLASGPLNGYIDDLRITKGIARYTSNFTPPTTAFLTL